MPFLITDSGFIAAATSFTIAVLVGALAFSMQARGLRQRHQISHHRWASEVLHRKAELGAQLNIEGGRRLGRTAVGLFLWAVLALVLPYDRVPFLQPVVTFAPAAVVIAVTGRLAARYRALLRS